MEEEMWRAAKDPDNFFFICADGMSQGVTSIPHIGVNRVYPGLTYDPKIEGTVTPGEKELGAS